MTIDRAELEHRFSMGWNGDDKFVSHIGEYSNFIHDVYFSVPSLASGRNHSTIDNPRSFHYVPHLIRELQGVNIHPHILMNGLCHGDRTGSKKLITKVLDNIKYYYNECGVVHFTFVSITDMMAAKKVFPDIVTHSSVNMFINTEGKARQVTGFADIINVDRDVNYDLDLIGRIKQTTGSQMLLNTVAVFSFPIPANIRSILKWKMEITSRQNLN